MKKLSFVPGLLLLMVIVAAGATPANAAIDAYIKFDGIDGEATARGHEDWIIVDSVSTPLDLQRSSTAATRRRGDVVLEDIVLVKKADKASPKLSEAVCKGKVFPKVEIHLTASYTDPGRTTYYRYELTNVRVSSYSVSAAGSSGDAVPMEEIALNYEEVKVSYAGPHSKGKKKGNVETSWKVEEGE